MNKEQYRQRLGELRSNWNEPSFDRDDPDWIDLNTGEPRGESRSGNEIYCIQLRAKKDLVIRYLNQWAILTEGSVIEYFSVGMMGASFWIVSGEMWTRRKEGEPYLVMPYRMDYHEDGRVNHDRVYSKKYSIGYINANTFVCSFKICGYTNRYPDDRGLFHKSMWDLQYIKTIIQHGDCETPQYMTDTREWGTRIYSDTLHPKYREES